MASSSLFFGDGEASFGASWLERGRVANPRDREVGQVCELACFVAGSQKSDQAQGFRAGLQGPAGVALSDGNQHSKQLGAHPLLSHQPRLRQVEVLRDPVLSPLAVELVCQLQVRAPGIRGAFETFGHHFLGATDERMHRATPSRHVRFELGQSTDGAHDDPG
jgi:hypothetical protein